MYVYLKSENNLWTVGFYDPKGEWHPESDHDDKEAAAKRVNYLNGGGYHDFDERLTALENGHKMELVADRIHTGVRW